MIEIEKSLERQKLYFETGKTRPISFRINQLKALLAKMKNMEQEMLDALRDDLGRSDLESYAAEIGFIYREIEHTIKNLRSWSRPRRVRTPLLLAPGRSYIQKEPKGVVLIIGAWNYPIQLVLAPLIGAIAAGNCIVIKPSELARASEAILSKLIAEGFGPEYCNVICGGPETTSWLTRQAFGHIFFTGSTKVGKFVMENAAQNLVPVTLELGGKSPCIVDRDVDVTIAAKRIVHGKFFNAGQTCVAPDYVLVHSSIRDRLVDEMKKAISSFFGEEPEKSKNFGRIVNDSHFTRIIELLSGGKVAFGGRSNTVTRYIAPTLLLDVDLESKLMKEEIFGPLLPILTFESIQDVIKIVSLNPNPLSCYIFSCNESFTSEITQKISFGGGCINSTLLHLVNANLPFGGVGQSGFGSYHGQNSFDIFSHHKSILKTYFFLDNGLRYVPHKGSIGLIRWLFRL